MADELQFYGWQRSGVYDLSAGALEDGRLQATLPLTIRNRDNPADHADRPQNFLILGPRDVLDFQPDAVVGMYPPPNSNNAETTKFVYVELGAADLPWRYTPQLAAGLRLRPWIVLIVGTTEEIEIGARNMITFSADVANAHDLTTSARWAHVQDDGERMVARLLSPRALVEKQEYIAAIVPAFDAAGANAWGANASPTLPCYHLWRFRTAAAGDFKTLASRLKPAEADPELGQAPLFYQRVEPTAELRVRGALGPIGGSDPALSQDVIDDVQQLITPLTDPRGRPIVTLPRYGAPWLADPTTTTWGAAANGDPRQRGTAGLGLWAGIELQEQIMDAAADQVGALDIAAQRIRHLTFGLSAVRSLWNRRLPSDPAQRLLLYGPSLRRMVTGNGPVLDQIAGDGRPLPPRLFSSAARRVLRRGPARTALANPKATLPQQILETANRCPPEPQRTFDGLPHADSAATDLRRDPLDDLLQRGIADGKLHTDELVARFEQAAADPDWANFLGSLRDLIRRLAIAGRLPHTAVLEILLAVEEGDKERVRQLVERFRQNDEPDAEDILDFGRTIVTRPPKRDCRPIDLPKLEAVLTAAIDPTVAEPLVQRRVLDTITGLDDQPLVPTEVCLGIDFPVWTWLRDRNPDWLLPGVNSLTDDAVVGLQSNATFVDAFLLGLNAQVLNELRWRNVPVVAGCTPMRMFWGQIDFAAGAHKPDIKGVALWGNTPLGDDDHQPPPPNGTDLVVVFKSDLFRRYPQTIVYLAPAPLAGGEPDWDADPPFAGSDRKFPTFQGSIGEDITFFRFDIEPQAARTWWITLEEPPPGYSFRNDPPSGATDGATFAKDTFHDPVRVIIRGESLIPEA